MQGSWPTLLGELTAFAMVVAISPFSVIPAIALVMHSRAPRSTGLAFVAGWLAGKAAITTLFVQVPRLLDRIGDSQQGSSTSSAPFQIVIGVLLLAAGVWTWRRPEKPVSTPRWLDRLKGITPPWAGAVGVALTMVNPKVVLSCAAAGYAIGHAQVGALATVGSVAYFTAIAGSTAAIPILAYAISAHRVDPLLARLMDWMRRSSRALMVGILLLSGVVLIVVGIVGL
jgi:hypothetical protein